MSSDYNPTGEQFNIYGYIPSLAAAAVFLSLFGLLTVGHAALMVRSRAWWTLVIVVGGIAELVGWAGRLASNKSIDSLDDFLIQIVCLILAPTFFSAAIYTMLGQLISKLGREHSKISPRNYLILFVGSDLIALIVQAVGGAMAALALESANDSTTGTHIMVIGISLQLASMIVFSLLALDFYFRARAQVPFDAETRQAFTGIAVATFWILIRCIYRTIELAQGWTGFLITREGYFIALDSVPMVFTMLALGHGHPCFTAPAKHASAEMIEDSAAEAGVVGSGGSSFDRELEKDGDRSE